MTLAPPMNPEVKQQWIDALRSGEFKQGTGVLSNNGRFCCLGVLCELAVRAGQPVKVEGALAGDEPGIIAYDGSTGVLPESVMGWAGLTQANPTVSTGTFLDASQAYRDYTSLADLNDHGKDFNEIADLIEKNL